MAFARLAPHCGLTPVYGHTVGICDLRGGFSWSSLGNSLTSGLKHVGSFLSNTAQRIANSEGFQQAKQGLLQSGVLENAGNLAGNTLNSLIDIGRIKLEQDLQKLKNKALGNESVSQEQLAQLLAALNSPKPMAQNTPIKTTVPTVNAQDSNVTSVAPVISSEEPSSDSIPFRPRKRKRVSGWGAFLNDMTGDGVNSVTRRYCY
ncbi:pVI [Bovine adenovirus 6]|uniref:PVI n=1 Tax=Bovine adenovirus 6 TaxID=111167 RepID=K9MP24_9ADEN|nr:pVI [Bovine adenovirus 6]AFV70641.1 pVI [Bovine adenovirus 6]